jgi:hypothetical protein
MELGTVRWPRASRGIDPVSRYYLDTSAQIERNGGSNERRRLLKQHLQGERHSTSTQVLREWNRIVLSSCVALREALAASEDWTGVVNHMAKGWGRAAARHWQVTHWITDSDKTDFAVVEKRLDDFQRIRQRAMFRALIDTVRDGTNCDVARRGTRMRDGKWHYRPTCTKTDDICDQPSFLKANMDRARNAAAALETSNRKPDAKMGKKATHALNAIDMGGTKGEACHGAGGIGGDIAIALECAEDEILLTTDASFDLICPALGLQHMRLGFTEPSGEVGDGAATP